MFVGPYTVNRLVGGTYELKDEQGQIEDVLIYVDDLRPLHEDLSSEKEDEATSIQAVTPEPKKPERPCKTRRVVDKRDNAKRAKQAERTNTAELCNASDQRTDCSTASANKLVSHRGRPPKAKKTETAPQRKVSPRRLRSHAKTQANAN